MKILRALGAALAALALALPLAASAQNQPSYTLLNASNQTLKFQTYSYARGSWRDQEIFPNQTKRFTMRPGSKQGKVRIATANRGHVQYEVYAGRSYRIVWDAKKRVWDFRTSR